MSYILEALRKSESERQQDRLPESVRNGQPIWMRSHGRSNRIVTLLVIVLLLNLILLAWLFLRQQTPGLPVEQVSSALVMESAVRDDLLQSSGHPGIEEETSPLRRSVPEGTVAEPVAEPVAAEVAAPGERQAETGAAGTPLSAAAVARAAADPAPGAGTDTRQWLAARGVQAREQLVPVESLSTPTVVRQSVAAPATGTGKSAVEVPDALPDAIAPAPMQTVPDTGAAMAPASTPMAAAYVPAAPQDEDAIPTLDSMPSDFRSRVPRLEFSSHIYSSRPDDRRIMINQKYLREGQQVDGLRVVEITGEGVVLSLQGTLFRIPVLRDWSPDAG